MWSIFYIPTYIRSSSCMGSIFWDSGAWVRCGGSINWNGSDSKAWWVCHNKRQARNYKLYPKICDCLKVGSLVIRGWTKEWCSLLEWRTSFDCKKEVMEWRGFSNVSMMTRWYSYQFFFLKACQSVRLCSFFLVKLEFQC